ncbi:MAG: putative MFS-type transporter YhhS [Desulfovibrio sp.]
MTTTTQEPTIFNRNFFAAAAVNLCIMTSYYLLFVVTSAYAQTRFEAEASTAGLVAGLMVVGSFIGRFLCGRFVTLLGCKVVLLAGIAIFTVGMALYFVAFNLPLLMLVRLISGIGVGSINTVTGTVVAYVLPENKRGLGISYFSLSTILALALGPYLGMTMIRATTYEMMFLFCVIMGVLSFACAFFLNFHEETTATDPNAKPVSNFALANYLDSRVFAFGIYMTLVGVGYGSIQSFMAKYAEELNMGEAASLFFPVYAAVVFLSRPYTGKIFDTLGENRVLYPATVLMAAGLALLGAAASPWTILLAGACIGAGFGNILSIGQAVSLKLVPRERFAHATSTFYVLLDCGLGFGPYFLGFVVPSMGYQGVFTVAALMTAVALPLYYFLHGKQATLR